MHSYVYIFSHPHIHTQRHTLGNSKPTHSHTHTRTPTYYWIVLIKCQPECLPLVIESGVYAYFRALELAWMLNGFSQSATSIAVVFYDDVIGSNKCMQKLSNTSTTHTQARYIIKYRNQFDLSSRFHGACFRETTRPGVWTLSPPINTCWCIPLRRSQFRHHHHHHHHGQHLRRVDPK